MSKISQLFGKKEQVLIDYGSGIKLPKFTSLRDPLQYEDLQAKVEAAATADASSQALDKYIFHKDGVEVDDGYKTQFELTIPETMILEQTRLLDIGRRDATLLDVQNLKLKSEVSALEAKKSTINSELIRVDRDLKREGSVLDGETPGNSGLMKPGRRLVAVNWPSRVFTTYKSLILKAFAAGVDAIVVMQTIARLVGDDYAGIIMGASAVLIQVIVPHLIGEKLALARKSPKKDGVQLSILWGLIAVWLAVVFFLTNVRFTLIGADLAKVMKDVPTIQLFQTLVAVFTAAILVGLGLLIIWEAYRGNKHEINYLNLEHKKTKLQNRMNLVEAQLASANSRMQTQEHALRRLDESLETQAQNILNIYPSLGNLWYRRALTNEIGDPNFTTEATK